MMFRVNATGITDPATSWSVTPVELLRRADAVMRSRWPTLQPHFYFDGIPLRCQFVYPGELRVHCASTGQLLARSRPGTPTRPASVTGRVRAAPAPRA